MSIAAKSSNQSNSRRQLSLENLERRQLMAGNITATLNYQGGLTIIGSQGDDGIYVSQVNNRLTVQGVATFNAASVRAIQVVAGAGNDEVIFLNPATRSGTQHILAPTVIYGGDGHDLISGGSSLDIVYGGAGHDDIYGSYGDDILAGESGNDEIYGGYGNDYLFGAQGDDYLVGADGDDFISGGDNWDKLFGGAGNDVLSGGLGYDWLYGNEGRNYLVDTYSAPVANTYGNNSYYNSLTAQPYLPPLSTQANGPMRDFLGADIYDGIYRTKTIPNFFKPGA